MSSTLRVGIVGDFDPGFRPHVATNEAISHAAEALALGVEPEWVPTPSLDGVDPGVVLERFDGLWVAPGSPYKSLEGALRAIRLARARGRPYVAT